MKHILVAYGNGITASAVVTTRIREKCEDNEIPVSVTQCKLLGVEPRADDFDLLVTAGKLTDGSVNIPAVSTIPLLTGTSEDATLNELLSYLK